MRIDEYKVMRGAFEAAFGFMLNRIEEGFEVDMQRERNIGAVEEAEARCWDEFMIALDAAGVTFTELSQERKCCMAEEDE